LSLYIYKGTTKPDFDRSIVFYYPIGCNITVTKSDRDRPLSYTPPEQLSINTQNWLHHWPFAIAFENRLIFDTLWWNAVGSVKRSATQHHFPLQLSSWQPLKSSRRKIATTLTYWCHAKDTLTHYLKNCQPSQDSEQKSLAPISDLKLRSSHTHTWADFPSFYGYFLKTLGET